MSLPSLYYHPSRPSGSDVYWYTAGFNWRAILAFTLALVPNLPGFALKVNSDLNIPIGAKYLLLVRLVLSVSCDIDPS